MTDRFARARLGVRSLRGDERAIDDDHRRRRRRPRARASNGASVSTKTTRWPHARDHGAELREVPAHERVRGRHRHEGNAREEAPEHQERVIDRVARERHARARSARLSRTSQAAMPSAAASASAYVTRRSPSPRRSIRKSRAGARCRGATQAAPPSVGGCSASAMGDSRYQRVTRASRDDLTRCETKHPPSLTQFGDVPVPAPRDHLRDLDAVHAPCRSCRSACSASRRQSGSFHSCLCGTTRDVFWPRSNDTNTALSIPFSCRWMRAMCAARLGLNFDS